MLSLSGRKEMLRRKQVACEGGDAGKPQKSPARGSRLPKWDYLRRSKKTSSPKPHSLQILKNPVINSLQETHFKDIHGQRVKRWKKILRVNGNQKKGRVAILVSGKIHFQ